MEYLPLNKKEVLRYLGYRKEMPPLTPVIDRLIDHVLREIQEVSTPRFTYRILPVKPGPDGILVGDSGLVFPGKNAKKILQKADRIILMAATLGLSVETAIRKYELTDLTHGMILDAAAAEMIEKYLDAEEAKVLTDPALAGLTMNRRFSPGYGDLPLSVQKGFLTALDAERTVGIHLTATNLMVPRKSVTAFMAAYRDPQDVKFKRRPAKGSE